MKKVPFPLTAVREVEGDATYPYRTLLLEGTEPLVVKGFASKWPATQRWSFDYLRTYLGERHFNAGWSSNFIFPGGRQGAIDQGEGPRPTPLEYHKVAVKDVLARIDDPTNPHYLAALHIQDELELLADVPFAPARDPDFQPLLWLSSPGHVTPTHYDGGEALFVQLRGRKRFVMFPPEAFEALYPFGVDHPQARYSRMLDLTAPDFERYPKAKGLTGYEAVLEPGSMLFVPQYWWHNVFTDSTSVSINFLLNNDPRTNLNELLGYWETLHQMFDETFPADMPPIMRVYALRMLLFPSALSVGPRAVADVE